MFFFFQQKKKTLKKENKNCKKNHNVLVLPIEDISLQQELSSQPLSEYRGGYPDRDTRTNEQTDGNS